VRGQTEVAPHELEQVRGRFGGEDALHDVLVARVALRLPLEDPPAGLGAEYVRPPLLTERLRGVVEGRAPTKDELAEVAEGDRSHPVRVPLHARTALPPALGDAL